MCHEQASAAIELKSYIYQIVISALLPENPVGKRLGSPLVGLPAGAGRVATRRGRRMGGGWLPRRAGSRDPGTASASPVPGARKQQLGSLRQVPVATIPYKWRRSPITGSVAEGMRAGNDPKRMTFKKWARPVVPKFPCGVNPLGRPVGSGGTRQHRCFPAGTAFTLRT
jgi:hypothetical protein